MIIKDTGSYIDMSFSMKGIGLFIGRNQRRKLDRKFNKVANLRISILNLILIYLKAISDVAC